MIKLTDTKLILTGSILEVHSYMSRPLAYGGFAINHNVERKKIIVIDEESEQRKIESRKRSLRRAGSILRKLVNTNSGRWKSEEGVPYDPIFVTLTFRDDIRDVFVANKHFTSFIRQLKYLISGRAKKCNLKYLAVIDFQDANRNGVVHYHLVFFNLNNKNLLSKAWKHGSVDIREVKEIENVGLYMSKQLSQHSKDTRLDGYKRYFSSKGLLKPIKILDQDKARSIIKLIPSEYVSNISHFDGFQGSVKNVQYKLNNNETLFDIIPELNNML